MDTIKLRDISFGHSTLGYASDYQTSNSFKWDRSDGHNITEPIVYTDFLLGTEIEGCNNYGWLMEPVEFAPHNYLKIKEIQHRFTKIFTHEKTLLDLGSPYEFIPGGGCWISSEDQKIYEKTKSVSIISSNKNMITGHQLRHTIINKLQNQIDVYGRGWNPIDYKLNGLKDYRFTIVVENCKRDYWFTEKLLDSFACGTVPIYWGCPSIGDFFDTRGMLIFNDIVELETILQNLTEQVYINMLPHIQHNFDESKKYMLPDAWIHKKIMK